VSEIECAAIRFFILGGLRNEQIKSNQSNTPARISLVPDFILQKISEVTYPLPARTSAPFEEKHRDDDTLDAVMVAALFERQRSACKNSGGFDWKDAQKEKQQEYPLVKMAIL
jgi:hypothetical protein